MNQFEVKIHRMGSGHIQAKYYDPKTGKRKRKRFYALKDAKNFKSDIEKRIQSKGEMAFCDLRISQAMKDFLQLFPNSTVRDRQNHFKSFIDTFGVYKIQKLSVSDLKEWFADRKAESNLSERTLNAIKSSLSPFFCYLVDENYLEYSPLEKIKFKRFDTPRRKRVILSANEVRTVLSNAKEFSPHILNPYLAIAAHTGARRGEILNLNRNDIDFGTELIHYRETKNSHERFVRISPQLGEILKDQVDSHEQIPLIINEESKRMGYSALNNHINKFKAFFPLEKNWGSHCLRHSFAYNFLKNGGKMYQLQAILGHRSIDVTIDLYGQLQAQDIASPSPY